MGRICEYTGTKIIFCDLRVPFMDNLYKPTVSGTRLDALIEPLDLMNLKPPLKLSTNQEVRNLSSCYLLRLEVLALILLLLMLSFCMTVTGTQKLTCRLRIVLIG
ncbi:hypothetical protein RIF29_38979 [Crotalaria pallida]|uniref:PATROL1-like C-terminal domain-containing protein n=1 Tax=Crotalaria pallida TaxID=3830 RepID=A0AAN9E175_CROPI